MPSKRKSGSFDKQREIEKKKRQKRKKRLIITIILAIITGIIIYLLNSKTFKLTNIEITGNTQLNNKEIIQQSNLKLGKSIFLNFNIITKVRLKQNCHIQDVDITKKMPNTIKIKIIEREPSFQIKTENGYYIVIDEQGYVIECLQEPKNLIIITGMQITEENIENKKRLENEDLTVKMENILHIKEETTNIGIYDQISEIQVKNEYILNLENKNVTINLGNCTNLKNRMYYVKSILEKENGNSGTINVNGNLNEGFVPYFTPNR